MISSAASTTAQETTTTTPPPLFGYISSATYNISISGNPQYIASFDIDPRRPGGFIAVDDTLHMVYEFNIHDLTVSNKALSLDNSAEMRNCDKFTLKDFCTEVLCFESNISYCAQGCPGSVDFCAMG
ncbi:unnamed protein product [Toxocara canis]|uniref:Lectin_legB domain-containing protein n=1 Tax=Toxocara canis TaxID=6265 RepID=A0A183U6S5_TOXCA|nr:unnamed protein product [Toxocara canis]